MIILDTPVLIEIERGNSAVIDRLQGLRMRLGDVCLTSAVYAEALHGFLAIGKGDEGEEFLGPFTTLPFDREGARICALLKRDLEKKGTSIPAFDLITASIAMAKNAALATSDDHFKSIPDLKLVFF